MAGAEAGSLNMWSNGCQQACLLNILRPLYGYGCATGIGKGVYFSASCRAYKLQVWLQACYSFMCGHATCVPKLYVWPYQG